MGSLFVIAQTGGNFLCPPYNRAVRQTEPAPCAGESDPCQLPRGVMAASDARRQSKQGSATPVAEINLQLAQRCAMNAAVFGAKSWVRGRLLSEHLAVWSRLPKGASGLMCSDQVRMNILSRRARKATGGWMFFGR